MFSQGEKWQLSCPEKKSGVECQWDAVSNQKIQKLSFAI